MSDPGKAVFLSYASQDAEAAKKICDALRAEGVEVWFDAEGGLEHGDEWDAKIRRQIKDCVLFLPIISANTQAREEGYFRLEWDLAAERARTIASGVAFILPVLVDDTRESEALVPDRFRTVQWTKLPGGAVSAEVLQRFLKLWSHRTGALKHRAGGGASLDDARGRAPSAPLQNKKSGIEEWWWLIFPVFGMATGLFWMFRPSSAARRALPETTAVAAAAPQSETRQLVTKAWEQLNRTGLYRAELEIADGLLKRAAELAQDDPDVWAAWAHVDAWYVYHNLDPSPERREGARQKAARAMRLDAQSFEARLADACYIVRATGAQPGTGRAGDSLPVAERTLRDLVRERPDDHRPRFALGILLRNAGRFDEGVAEFERMAQLPGRAATAWNEIGWLRQLAGDFQLAVEAADRSIAEQPYVGNLLLRLSLARSWTGDLELAKAAAAQLPPSVRTEEVIVANTAQMFRWRREPAEMLRILDAVPRAWIASQGFNGPRFFLVAEAHRMAGRENAAQLGWREALRLIEQRLEKEADSAPLLTLKARTLWALGRQPEARQTARLAESFGAANNLDLLLEFGELDRALATLEQLMAAPTSEVSGVTRWAELKLNPRFDPLRSDPRFQSLLAQAEADPRRNPHAMTRRESSDTSPAAGKSVAVLAFANLSDDKANEYFSDGISEELLNVLAKIPGLKVSARTSAFYFKGKEVPVPEIAKQLGVAYVIEGSVRKAGNQVRITAQLIKAADGFHVWSDTFTRDLKDIFAVQDEIAGLIAKNLELKMGMGEVGARQVVSSEAYQAFLLGRAAVAKASMADLRAAVTHFERAVALEPKYTAAWVQLASTHTRLGRWGGTPTLQAWGAARTAIDRARALEPDSPEMLVALGWILRTGEWDWRGAEQAFRRALALQPNQPDVLAGAAVLLFNVGQTTEAFRLCRQAVQLDPLNPGTQIDLSIMFYLNGNPVEAEQAARRALQLAPDGASYHAILSWSLIAQGRFAEAEAEIALETDIVEQPTSRGLLAISRGEGTEAKRMITQLEDLARVQPDAADLQQSIAWMAALLGDKEKAFATLERARGSRDPSMSWLRNSKYLKTLESDPRWNTLLHKMGLADEQLK